jgi:ubiquinone/menaquinone biosynthesis C-methylase UbiE
MPESWELVADAYTAEVLSHFELFARDALALAALPPASRVLDVATTPGTLALMASRAGAAVTAIDFSPAMIANLRRRAAEAGATAIDVRVGDGQALPLEDDSYDGVFSLFGLMFFPDRGAGFREFRRVLRPGRRAVVSAWAPFAGPFALMMDSIRRMLPGLPSQGKWPLGDPEDFRIEMRRLASVKSTFTRSPIAL